MFFIVKYFLLILILCYCYSFNVYATEESYIIENEIKKLNSRLYIKEDVIRKTVEFFCQKEFEGIGLDGSIREHLIKYTVSEEEKIRNYAKMSAYYAYTLDDPLHIINSYELIELKLLDQSHAYVIVKYHHLGSIYNGVWEDYAIYDLRNSVKKDICDVIVKLKLEYDNGRWWIIDPPVSPMVSYDVVYKHYASEIVSIENEISMGYFSKEDLVHVSILCEDYKHILGILHCIKN